MENKILVETSARHIHLTKEAVETLFGAGHELTKKKDLSQPGQFACEEKVEVVGTKGTLKMSVLGPTRPENQVELSFTDARTLGVTAPVRESGDVAGTPGILLKGPAGEMINAMAIGIEGDIAVEQDNLSKGASLFEKAAAASDNQFTTPMYLRKASQAYRAMGNVEKANELLKTIQDKYPSSLDSREATTFIGD